MKYRLKDLFQMGGYSDVYSSKKEVLNKLAEFHNDDFLFGRDDFHSIFELLDTLKNDEERLDFLLKYGYWELEEVGSAK